MNYDGIGETPYTMKIIVRYFESREEEVVCGEDAFPLMSQVNINSASIVLPEWATSILNPSPSPSPSPETAAAPEPFPTTLVVAAAVTAAVFGIGLLINFKKRKQ